MKIFGNCSGPVEKLNGCRWGKLWLLVALIVSAGSSWAKEDSFCEKALARTQEISNSKTYTRVKVDIRRRALESAERHRLEDFDLEEMIQTSQVSSFRKDKRNILVLFHSVRDKKRYRDYVYAAEVQQAFTPGRTKSVTLLDFFRPSTIYDESKLMRELAESEKYRGFQFPISSGIFRKLEEGWEIPRGPMTVTLTPMVRAKIFLKHNIDLNLLRAAFGHPPDIVRLSSKGNQTLEMIYETEDQSLLIVVAKGPKPETLNLVTSYFFSKELQN